MQKPYPKTGILTKTLILNKFLQVFLGKFGIFMVIRKTLILMKRKSSNSESAPSKSFVENEFTEKQKK